MQPSQKLYFEGLSRIAEGDNLTALGRLREAIGLGLPGEKPRVLVAALEALLECDRVLAEAEKKEK